MAPLAYGGNHPLAWLGWGLVIAVVAMWRLAAAPLAQDFRPLGIFGLGFAVVAVFVLAQPSGRGMAMPGLVRLGGCLVLAGLIFELASDKARARRFGWMVFAGVALNGALGMVLLLALGDAAPWGGKAAYLGQATGGFVNRNSFATFLAIGLVLGLSLLRPRRMDMAELILALAGVGVILVALLATQSRLGLASAAVGAVVCLWLRSGLRPMLLPVLGAGLVALTIAAPQVLERMLFLESAGALRLTLYRDVWQMILASPWSGHGFDAFAPAFERFHGPDLPAHLVWDRAHSTYLTLWAELGLIVGSVPLVLGVLALWRLDPRAPLGIAGISALVVGGFHSLGDFSLEMQANLMLLLSVVVLGMAQGGSERSPAHHGPERSGLGAT